MSQNCADLLAEEDLSPTTRYLLERLQQREQKRAADRARLGEEGLRRRRVSQWQRDSLREFHKLLALQFEALAWENRSSKPLWSCETTNDVMRKRRGLQQRLAKARKEAAEGCPLQVEWLAKHAELIHALEYPPEFPMGRFGLQHH